MTAGNKKLLIHEFGKDDEYDAARLEYSHVKFEYGTNHHLDCKKCHVNFKRGGLRVWFNDKSYHIDCLADMDHGEFSAEL